ncbi:hypothetical protein [Priestia flexa]|uniref:hypothetical protein n=1 Tax=Priestia flexa TaxID=86664 RepID=UPI000AEB0997|nr:hypothetical protein [Priestia flexa]
MIEYSLESSFNHYETNEKLYRVKVTYPSGGTCYQVMNEDQLKLNNVKGES